MNYLKTSSQALEVHVQMYFKLLQRAFNSLSHEFIYLMNYFKVNRVALRATRKHAKKLTFSRCSNYIYTRGLWCSGETCLEHYPFNHWCMINYPLKLSFDSFVHDKWSVCLILRLKCKALKKNKIIFVR